MCSLFRMCSLIKMFSLIECVGHECFLLYCVLFMRVGVYMLYTHTHTHCLPVAGVNAGDTCSLIRMRSLIRMCSLIECVLLL